MTFANPNWLLLLVPLPFFVIVAGITWQRRGERWHEMVADRHRDRLSHQRPVWIYFTSLALGLFGLAGLIVAYAQPESGEEWIETKNEGRNILALRRYFAKHAHQGCQPQPASSCPGCRSRHRGAVSPQTGSASSFSPEKPLVQVPLTIDHTFIQQSLAQLNPVDLPIGGLQSWRSSS